MVLSLTASSREKKKTALSFFFLSFFLLFKGNAYVVKVDSDSDREWWCERGVRHPKVSGGKVSRIQISKLLAS